MRSKLPVAKDVDEYISRHPRDVQTILRKIRATIRKNAPAAREVISYSIPGYMYEGMLIFFAAFKGHVSVYPAPRSHAAFKEELSAYKGGKGTVQFAFGEPVPYDLITKIVKFRVRDNEERSLAKKSKAKPTGKKVPFKTKSKSSAH